MNIKEVKSFSKSIEILNKYKHKLTNEQFERIFSTISSHAIENQFANEQNILDLIALETEELDVDELIKIIKKRCDYE
ncbi:hypothetical protein [Campylobacter sp. MG1]|uniref:hypothetical protein n=1 Tax=Campylobacter sp. MG1 TaxID=2976332 RepID=UPI00226CE260|nr:hypothetical protein [Campylobacter sp. MG1]